jgi:predicted GIY-YIG superfamily endonuclease
LPALQRTYRQEVEGVLANAGEKAIGDGEDKRWKRAWKVSLIEKRNPDWDDLYSKLS